MAFDVTPNAIGKVTVDIAAGAATDAGGNGNAAAGQLALGIPYDDDGNGAIGKSEVVTAINDYLFGEGDEAISKSDVITLINLYLFRLIGGAPRARYRKERSSWFRRGTMPPLGHIPRTVAPSGAVAITAARWGGWEQSRKRCSPGSAAH